METIEITYRRHQHCYFCLQIKTGRRVKFRGEPHMSWVCDECFADCIQVHPLQLPAFLSIYN
jgi:hypothetical protein